MKATNLTDRGVVKVAGIDARKFLNGLVTTDMGKVTASSPRYAALLTPQGKIIVDFIIADLILPMATISTSIARVRSRPRWSSGWASTNCARRSLSRMCPILPA